MSWFVLILGGASLFEKPGWGIVGALMLLFGLVVLGYTAFAIYLHKPLVKKPAYMLVASMVFILVLIAAHISFGHLVLAMILAALAVPVLIGYFRIRGKSHGSEVKSAKRKG